MSVLSVLVVVGLLATAALFSARESRRAAERSVGDAQLVAAAETALFGALADWDAVARGRQARGETVALLVTPLSRDVGRVRVFVTRLTMRVYAIIADVTTAGDDASRRLSLLVRAPLREPALASAIVSAGDVSLGPAARIVPAESSSCGGVAAAAVTLAPGAQLVLDSARIPSDQLTTRHDAAAADSLTYLRVAGETWQALAGAADVRLTAGAHVSPSPSIEDGRCADVSANWGEPQHSEPASQCEQRAPIVYAAGDLTIDGGRGRGVLLVEGRLRLAGPLSFFGQIVALGGIETIRDGIEVSGTMLSGSRATTRDATHTGTAVSLRHATTVRYSVCDAQHGIASWLQPRPVRERAWAELF